MAEVEIRSISTPDRWGDYDEDVEIYVDGVKVAEGWYGGEPEDNARGRQYSWVEDAFEALAKALGASVKSTAIERER